jgi:hypothetical protein
MKRRPRTRRSPRNLVAFATEAATFEEAGFALDETEPGHFVIRGQPPGQRVDELLHWLERIACLAITEAGGDPVQWPRIIAESDEADPAFVAARVLGKGSRLHQLLRSEEHSASALQLLIHALELLPLVQALPIVENEIAIDAHGKSVEASRRGAAEKATNAAARNLRLATLYREEREKAPSWRSDTSLKAAIGKREEGLGRSAAIEAINKGLHLLHAKISSGGRGKPDN